MDRAGELLDIYLRWRMTSIGVRDAYAVWQGARADGRAGAHRSYEVALASEERAAQAYAGAIEAVEHDHAVRVGQLRRRLASAIG